MVTARASCLLAEGAQGVPVTFTVASAPAWARTKLDPETVVVPATACDGGWLAATAVLNVSADAAAPAATPAPIVLAAVAGPAGREARAEAQIDASATFYAVLELQLPEAIFEAAPGATLCVPLIVANGGNGPTVVTASLAEPPEDLTVTLPEPFTLGARADAPANAREVELVVTAGELGALANEVRMVNVRLTSAFEKDPAQAGDGSQVSLLVTIRGPALQQAKEVPLSALAALLALGVAARTLRR